MRMADPRGAIEPDDSHQSVMEDSGNPPDSVIFLHIPKCAGSTLRNVIERQYPSGQTYRISPNPSPRESIREFKNLPESEQESIRALSGHGGFSGLHNYLPGKTEYVTLLRNPIDRVISNYYYVRRTEGHRHYETAREMSLREYVTSGVNKALDNQMVRSIAGSGAGGKNEEADAERFRQAKENLNKYFGVVGLVEYFDKSILLMKQHFGWGDVSYQKRNVSSNRPAKEDLPVSLREEIEERNHWDRKLYEYGEQQLNRKLNKSDLRLELRWLQFRCWLQGRTGSLLRNSRAAAGHLLDRAGIKSEVKTLLGR